MITVLDVMVIRHGTSFFPTVYRKPTLKNVLLRDRGVRKAQRDRQKMKKEKRKKKASG